MLIFHFLQLSWSLGASSVWLASYIYIFLWWVGWRLGVFAFSEDQCSTPHPQALWNTQVSLKCGKPAAGLGWISVSSILSPSAHTPPTGFSEDHTPHHLYYNIYNDLYYIYLENGVAESWSPGSASQRAAKTRTEPGQGQKPRTPCGSLPCIRGSELLGPSSLTSQAHEREAGLEVKTTRTPTSTPIQDVSGATSSGTLTHCPHQHGSLSPSLCFLTWLADLGTVQDQTEQSGRNTISMSFINPLFPAQYAYACHPRQRPVKTHLMQHFWEILCHSNSRAFVLGL